MDIFSELQGWPSLKRYLFSAVFLLPGHPITVLRQLVQHGSETWRLSEFQKQSTLLLAELVNETWVVCEREKKEYKLALPMDFDTFLRLVDLYETQDLMQCCRQAVPSGLYVGAYNNDRLKDLYFNCCAGYLAKGELQNANETITQFRERYEKYCYTPNVQFDLTDVGGFLISLKGFVSHLFTLSPQIIDIFTPMLPHAMSMMGFAIPDSVIASLRPGLARLCLGFLKGDRILCQQEYLAIRKTEPASQPLLEALTALASGDFLLAEQRLAAVIKMIKKRERHPVYMMSFCCLLHFFVACMAKCGHQKISESFSRLQYIGDRLYRTERMCDALRDLYFISEYYGRDCDPPSLTLETPPQVLADLLILNKLPGWNLRSTEAQNAFEYGRKLVEIGNVFWGVQILNAAGTFLERDDSQRDTIAQLTQQSGFTPLCPMGSRYQPWEIALNAFTDALENLEKKGDSENKPAFEAHLSWHLYAYDSYGKPLKNFHKVRLGRIYIQYHKRLKSGVMGAGHRFEISKAQLPEFQSCISDSEQKALAMASWDGTDEVPPEAIVHLVKSEHVYLGDDTTPIKLIQDNQAIKTSFSGDGLMELSLKYPYDSYHLPAVLLDLSTSGVCHFYTVSKPDPIKAIFDKQQDRNGVITIPQAGFARMKQLLCRLSPHIDIEGEMADATYQALTERRGGTELHARIKRQLDGFIVDFRVKPLADCDVMFKPGDGPMQKVTTLADGQTVLLKREFDEETAAFKAKLENCPALPASTCQSCQCDIFDPEQALQTLVELRDAGFVMEWQSGKPIVISKPLDYSRLQLYCSSALEWFSIGGTLEVSDDLCIQLAELLKAAENRTGTFVRLTDDSFLQLTQDLVRKIDALRAAGHVAQRHLEISPAALPMLSNTFADNLPAPLQSHIDQIRQAFKQPVRIPSTFAGTLRPYQVDGFNYLARLADCGIGCCLADDMGLGKTIQILALLLRDASKGPALVVCPASLCQNWVREARKFAPSLNAVILNDVERESAIKQARKGDVVICSYGILWNESENFAAKQWQTIILDEAQAIKNTGTKRAKSTKLLKGNTRIAVTGTPIENHLLELWSIFDFLNPGLLGSASTFETDYCLDGMARPELKKLVSPLILRRKKCDVLDDLPPKTEVTIMVELPDEDRAMYETLRRKAVSELTSGDQTHIAVLAQLSRLRTFCCAPELVYGADVAGQGAKLNRLMELVEELHEGGHRALVFSQFVSFLAIIRGAMDARRLSYQYLDGTMSPAKRQTAVDDFQNGIGDFFLISLKAGGVGLNLTAANYVIIADPWWNPAVEDQAADRTHRIGQTQPVTVYRLITAQTVEEKIQELHGRKRQASDDILNNAQTSGITVKELMALLE